MALSDLLRDMRIVRARKVVPAVIAVAIGVLSWFGVGPLLFGGGEGSSSPPPAPPPVVATDVVDSAEAPVLVAEPEPAVFEVEPEPEPFAVLVARRDLELGTLMRHDDLAWLEWQQPIDMDTVFIEGETHISQVLGAVVAGHSAAGRPVRRDALIVPGAPGFLAAVLAPGKRAVTVEADGATTSAGVVFPGDRVDVILVATSVPGGAGEAAEPAAQRIVRDARVLAVGSNVSLVTGLSEMFGDPRLVDANEGNQGGAFNRGFGGGGGPLGNTFTLEVAPRDADRLSLASTAGQINLAMRSLAQSATADPHWTPPVRMADVMIPDSVPHGTVRVLRGAASESVLLSGGGAKVSSPQSDGRDRDIGLAVERALRRADRSLRRRRRTRDVPGRG